MELDKYKVLIKTIETGSFSATASELGYSISGISRIIHSIESEMGFSLLERSRDGVVPTIKCLSVLPYIKEFIKAGDICLEEAHNVTDVPIKVRIGVAHVSLYSWLCETALEHKDQFPNMDVDLVYDTSSNLASMVERGLLDFSIITKRDGNFEWIDLWEDEEVAWIPSSHPLAKQSSVPISVFEKEACVLPFSNEETDYSIIFKKENIKPNLLISTKDDYAAYSVVGSGLGISINSKISSLSGDDRVKIVSLDPPVKLNIGIAASYNLSDVVKNFIDRLKVETLAHKDS